MNYTGFLSAARAFLRVAESAAPPPKLAELESVMSGGVGNVRNIMVMIVGLAGAALPISLWDHSKLMSIGHFDVFTYNTNGCTSLRFSLFEIISRTP